MSLCKFGIHHWKCQPNEEGGYGMGGLDEFEIRICQSCGKKQNKFALGAPKSRWNGWIDEGYVTTATTEGSR